NLIFRLNEEKGFLAYRVPVFVEKVVGGGPAAEAGIQPGDRIIAVDNVDTPSFTELTKALGDRAGKHAAITVKRDDKSVTLDADIDDNGKLGFQLRPITDIYKTVTVNYGFLGSIPKGWEIGTGTLANYVGSMKHLFSKEGAQSIGGFGAIGDMFPAKWSWYAFWQITAFLSVALAFMNIIPIPALDGGHVMFLLFEVITRRKPSEKVLEWAQYAGMAFLLLLLVYANGMDIFRAFK
ncbi:MAG: site-2 protease family protein, partial [Muribaculaceae bacterium]|nr:site-2 protease family protein [Muribaculaceae bacterium]